MILFIVTISSVEWRSGVLMKGCRWPPSIKTVLLLCETIKYLLPFGARSCVIYQACAIIYMILFSPPGDAEHWHTYPDLTVEEMGTIYCCIIATFCCCDKTFCLKATWERRRFIWLTLPGCSPLLREGKAATCSKNLGATLLSCFLNHLLAHA